MSRPYKGYLENLAFHNMAEKYEGTFPEFRELHLLILLRAHRLIAAVAGRPLAHSLAPSVVGRQHIQSVLAM
jgi:hypothetical protein